MSTKIEKIYGVEGLPFPKPGDEVVISGIAGRFPKSDNLADLRTNLFDKLDLTTDDCPWDPDLPHLPRRIGMINNVDKFDSRFFGVKFKEAHTMDPKGRILMEHAYEAIIDAGFNPQELRGTNTGVFIGTSCNESERTALYRTNEITGLGVSGCCRAMFANQISRWLGITGPSYNVDSACSSSFIALDNAFRAIRSGECDAALVGAANVLLYPNLNQTFMLLGVLSPDGHSKTFDNAADGYCRSEAAVMIYLQKSKNARRNYTQVVHTKTNCDGYKDEGITYPSSVTQAALMKQIYDECQVPPASVDFIEAHGTGTIVGDLEELDAIEKTFCPGRTRPLKIGSLKSNMGHSEPASGLCSIAKVVIAMESGYIPPNLHYNRPRKGIEALSDGRLQVITEPTPWEGGYVGINSFGFGGANGHVLLKSNPNKKFLNGAPTDDLPRLVIVSGRTEGAVATLLDDLESRPVDVEYVHLLHNIHREEISVHSYRGYTVLPPRDSPDTTRIRGIKRYSGAKRPVWFVFSGMGNQWAGLGEALLKIPTFARSVKTCDSALKPYGVDVIGILINRDAKILDDVLKMFIGVVVVQIGLVDTLAALGVSPHNITGHTLCELGCAYADGCLTVEQTVLTAYYMALALRETETIRGAMTMIGLSYEKLKGICPPNVDIAYHDSPEMSTISGPFSSVEIFTDALQADRIFTKNISCSSTAFHSHYIAEAGPRMLHYLKKVIPDPKQRSHKWLSTSVPCKRWTESSTRSCSPEYHTESLLNPVFFRDILKLVPANAVIIEIGPPSSLKDILGSVLGKNVTHIALTGHGNSDNHVTSLFQAIGKMYEVGLQPQVMNLYPDVQHPVSRGTAMISPLVRWEHSEDWYVVNEQRVKKLCSGRRCVRVTLADDAFEWLAGHTVDGEILFPVMGYLVLIWETLGMMMGMEYKNVSVVFENVRFHRMTPVPKKQSIDLMLAIQTGTGGFQVVEGDGVVVSGVVRAVSDPSQERISTDQFPDNDQEMEFTEKDIYKELYLRGYEYTASFRGLESLSLDGTKGRVAWKNNWTTFLDTIAQMSLLKTDARELCIPRTLQKLVIDTKAHLDKLRALPEDEVFPVKIHKKLDSIVSIGVEIRGMKTATIGRKNQSVNLVREELKFIAHRDRAQMELSAITRIAVQIVLENDFVTKIKTLEVISEDNNIISLENLVSPMIDKVLADIPLVRADIGIIASFGTFPKQALPANVAIYTSEKLVNESGASLVISHGLFSSKNSELRKQLKAIIKNGGFLLAKEPLIADTDVFSTIANDGFVVILEKRTRNELVILLRRKEELLDIGAVIHVDESDFAWLATLQATLRTATEKQRRTGSRILLVSDRNFESGLMGLVKCLRKEPGGEIFQGLLIQDSQAPKFSLAKPLYSEQLKLGLTLNVLRPENLWGSYRFFAMDPLTTKPVCHSQLHQLTKNDLTSLRWIEGEMKPITDHRNVVQVHYAPLNFRDVMLGTGKLTHVIAERSKYSRSDSLGMEFSGLNDNGNRVLGCVPANALSNFCVYDKDFIWSVPDNWSLEEAATVPIAYATAYTAFYIIGKIKKGYKVLIHSGSGGVGQAAITLALHECCEVFTTVGSQEKRQFVKTLFPQIDDNHIGNSRDSSFEQLVLRQTQGQGVDVVLNCLSEEKLQASIRCLRVGGQFLEIGKFDMLSNNSIGMQVFLSEISLHGIFLDKIFTAHPETKKTLWNLLDKGLKDGVVKPLNRTVFPMDQAEAAFRYMATGKHVGKVIIKIRDDEELHQSALPAALPRYYCSENASYLLIGGLGGFGLELADWLVLRGAKKLVLTSRYGISNGYQIRLLNNWKKHGVKVVVVAGKDVSTHEGCEAILQEAGALGPVDAIFNVAVVLHDALFENQTIESFKEPFEAKIWATKHLDRLSRTMCPHLRKFVVFSSVVAGRGNAGQTNYGMANSAMERICERRVTENLPGLAIQWGAIGDVGKLMKLKENRQKVTMGGFLNQRIFSCLQELDGFLLQNSPVVSSMVLAEKTTCLTKDKNIVDTILGLMGFKDLKAVAPQTPFSELGMDSITTVEIKQCLECEFGVFLTSIEIRTLNIQKLQEIAMALKLASENNTNDL